MICFRVYGIPQTKGSTKGFVGRSKQTGKLRAFITNDNTKNKAWAEGLRQQAQQYAIVGRPWEGPVDLTLIFDLVRPKSLPKKVVYHIKKPDLDKLTRSIKDALKGVIYYDDSQVVHLDCLKRYESPGEAPGVTVIVKEYQVQPRGVLPL